MTFLCPNCFSIVKPDTKICPACSYNISGFSELDYDKKLMMALHHWEPETVIRAIKILSEHKYTDAINEFFSLIENNKNPYITAEAAKAILSVTEVMNTNNRATLNTKLKWLLKDKKIS